MTRELTGWHVAGITVGAFAIIIAVNVTMAVKAVGTFPGLETANSYVASQVFDKEREAQEALGWQADATYADGRVTLRIEDAEGRPILPPRISADLGRPTNVSEDRVLELAKTGPAYTAPADLHRGLWVLRLTAEAADGTPFRQRLELRVRP
ncbi:nitrogen fixation protein FixH [Mesobaculum littorinae]|uniref:Nitrogen fixation protein FixH n=1 Tax=Mesobaculum littorinae TaxID=2486419 RepID=A0A438ADC5_9RHOB|nr:FixH family protein [Mesobaculum littorinae]RVV96700.1 nitrogen fixation protein FixH [Mesobaculum littorinae]